MASSQLALWSFHGRGDRCVTTMRPAVRGVMRECGVRLPFSSANAKQSVQPPFEGKADSAPAMKRFTFWKQLGGYEWAAYPSGRV